MNRISHFEPRFVEQIPSNLEEATLYVSPRYALAVHRCASGCGKEVVTPLGPEDWTLSFDGAVSLRPSIGNFRYDCRSHYWIIRDRVVWVDDSRGSTAAGPRGAFISKSIAQIARRIRQIVRRLRSRLG